MRKFIIGWITFKPEMRGPFLSAISAHVAATRQEEGCVFFDVSLSLDGPNIAVVTECFESEEAHESHLQTPHMNRFRAEMPRLLVEGRFENVYSDRFSTDVVEFS